MKLYEMAELLKKIKEGIRHECFFDCRIHELGLQFDVYFTRTIDRQVFEFHQCLSWDEMRLARDDDNLIQSLTHSVNYWIRKKYNELTDDVGKYVRLDEVKP